MGAVTVRSAIARCFVLLAIIGLMLSPVMRPAMAMPMAIPPAVSGVAEMLDTQAPGMAGDMPCCPGKPSVPDCNKDCPFMALCAGAVLLSEPLADAFIPLAVMGVVVPGDQSDLSGIAQAPPKRPPKI
jgi:hypothetical protein